MKAIIEFIKTYSFLILIIAIILFYVLGRAYDRTFSKNLHKNGLTSIAYVYDQVGAKAHVFDAKYYFFIKGKRVGDICHKPKGVLALNRFFIAYYMQDNLKKSILDFTKEIHPDSVYRFFPKGLNPFEQEVKLSKKLKNN